MNSFGLEGPLFVYRSVDSKWSFVISFMLRRWQDHFAYIGSGGSFRRRCLLPWLESLADHAFMNYVASSAILDVLVFPSSIVLDLLRNFNKGGYLLRLGVVVGIIAAGLLAIVLSRVSATVVVGSSTLVA